MQQSIELAETDRPMKISESSQKLDDSCVINASEKQGLELNRIKMTVGPRAKNDPNDFNFDFGVPNKGTPQIDQIFQ